MIRIGRRLEGVKGVKPFGALNVLSGGLFYSATLSDAVHGLVRDIGKAEYTFVDVIGSEDLPVPQHIEQFYSVVPTERMAQSLWRFSKDISVDSKAVAIFMTGRVAAYYAEAFRRAASELPVFEIHARRSQKQRTFGELFLFLYNSLTNSLYNSQTCFLSCLCPKELLFFFFSDVK